VTQAAADSLSLVRFDTNSYSAPTAYAYRRLTVVATVDVRQNRRTLRPSAQARRRGARISEFCVTAVDPNSPSATELMAVPDGYQAGLYPPASTHLLPVVDLARPGAVFLGAFDGGQMVGCCGYIRCHGYPSISHGRTEVNSLPRSCASPPPPSRCIISMTY
jgi:hypothetical protein